MILFAFFLVAEVDEFDEVEMAWNDELFKAALASWILTERHELENLNYFFLARTWFFKMSKNYKNKNLNFSKKNIH